MTSKKQQIKKSAWIRARLGLVAILGIGCLISLPQTVWAGAQPTANGRSSQKAVAQPTMQLAMIMDMPSLAAGYAPQGASMRHQAVSAHSQIPVMTYQMASRTQPGRGVAMVLLGLLSGLLFLGLMGDLWREPEAYARVGTQRR